MALQRVRRNAEADPGREYTFGVDPDNGRPVRFWVRRVPPAVRARVAARHKANRAKHRGAEIEVDLNARALTTRDIAVYALTRSENFSISLEDQAAAEAYSQLSGRDLPVGTIFSVDEAIGDEQVRTAALNDCPTVAEWILVKANEQDVKAAEDEEGKGES